MPLRPEQMRVLLVRVAFSDALHGFWLCGSVVFAKRCTFVKHGSNARLYVRNRAHKLTLCGAWVACVPCCAVHWFVGDTLLEQYNRNYNDGQAPRPNTIRFSGKCLKS